MVEDEQPELLFFDTFSHDINEVSCLFFTKNYLIFQYTLEFIVLN